VDLPNERKVHLRAVPRVGGVAMVAGVVLPVILWLWPSPQVIGMLLGMGVILAFGV
jgi:UDP-GlcNAc:undecaprenyl-phosphate GlcNAc-1-phosphate transferase